MCRMLASSGDSPKGAAKALMGSRSRMSKASNLGLSGIFHSETGWLRSLGEYAPDQDAVAPAVFVDELRIVVLFLAGQRTH
jgi:hypothetical protein